MHNPDPKTATVPPPFRPTAPALRAWWTRLLLPAACLLLAAASTAEPSGQEDRPSGTVTRTASQPDGIDRSSQPARPSVPSTGTKDAPKKPPYDLVAAKLVHRTISLLDARYLHPEDLDAPALFAAGVAGLARKAPDALWVEPDGDLPGALLVGQRTLLLDPTTIGTLDDISARFSSVFAFYLQSRQLEMDDIELEYAAIDGMLDSLDRPTRLLVDRRLDAFNLRSRGTLSGIGCRIGRRQDEATVVEVLEGGPAMEAGLREGDRILRVDGESTVNMPIQDLVQRIRGPVGSPVTLDIRRGTHPPRHLAFTMIRRKILLENVEVLLLPNHVGYLRITNFNDQTLHNFRERLPRLGDLRQLKGLVVDLRGNGGGSLKQSAFMVNEFVREGTIVRTEGRPDKALRGLVRRIDADSHSVLEGVPIAVLVDRRTASGAEILAGALKYMDRATVIGRRTFGKGTVQKVYRLQPKASVKLTVARYVLPGGHIIQSAGVQPDILLVPLIASEDQIRFREPDERDGDEGKNADTPAAPSTEPGASQTPRATPQAEDDGAPRRTVAYFRSLVPDLERPKAESRWLDFEIRFAARLLAKAGAGTRTRTLEAALPVSDALSEDEHDTIVAALATRGLDWSRSVGPPARRTAPPQLVVEGPVPASIMLRVDSENGHAVAGADAQLEVALTNTSNRPLSRVRVLSDCPDSLFDGLEFLFGRIEPGETRTWRVVKTIPAGTTPGLRVIEFRFLSDRFDVVGAGNGEIFVEGRPGPRLDLEVTYRDVAGGDAGGHLDGRVAPGERVEIHVRVRNLGEGTSGQIQVSLKNPLRKEVELVDARAILDPMAPGEEAGATLSFDLKEAERSLDEPVKVPLVVRDRAHHVRLERELDFGEPWTAAVTIVQPRVVLETSVPKEPWGHLFFRLAGQAGSPDGIKVVTFYRGNRKIDIRLPNDPAGGPVTSLHFKTRLPLEPGPNRLTVVCESASGLTSRQQVWVTAREP